MRKRPLLAAGVVLVAVVVGVGLGWALWHLRPSPLWAKLERVQIGMTREEVESVMGPATSPPMKITLVQKSPTGAVVREEVTQALAWDDGRTHIHVLFSSDDGRVAARGVVVNHDEWGETREYVREALRWFR